MYKHILHLPDGTAVSSGVPGQTAIRQVTLTQCVNTAQELEPGCVCAAMLEAQLLIPGPFTLQAGQEVTLERLGADGSRQQVGIFILEQPQRRGAHLYQLTAYDRISRLDRDLTQWLNGLEGWPYTLQTLAQLVCQACGLTLTTGQLPNGDYPVQKFTGTGITGRKLMQWIAQASCRFCRADPQGQLELCWYEPFPQAQIGGRGTAALQVGYEDRALKLTAQGLRQSLQDRQLQLSGLQLRSDLNGPDQLQLLAVPGLYWLAADMADYCTAPVGRVRICQSREDVGTVWPEQAGEENTYTLLGNPLLRALHGDSLKSVAQSIYKELSTLTCQPGTLVLPEDPRLQAGQYLTVTLPGGQTVPVCVMHCTHTGQTATVECTGSPNRQLSTAVNQTGFAQLGGKVLELQTDVDGLRLENRDAQDRLSRIEADVTGVRTRVEDWEDPQGSLLKRVSTLEQTAQGLQLRMEQVDAGQENGAVRVVTATGFTFDRDGLRIARQGQQMENRLDEDGMCVSRLGQPVLTATSEGVMAADVRVHHFLRMGEYARFEDYVNQTDGKRTACFFVG